MTPRARPPADVTVIGAGPAGLAAAAAAAERGRRVLVLDQAPRAGGQIWRHRDEASLAPAVRALLARVRRAGAFIVPNSPVIDALSPHELIVEFSGRVDLLETRAVIIATGARERFLPFPGWTTPGVTGIGGLQSLIKGGVDIRGKRVVLAGTGPLLFAVAAAVAKAGGKLLFVAEQASGARVRGFAARALLSPARLRDAIRYRVAFAGAPYRTDSWVTHALGTDPLQSVRLVSSGRAIDIECDWLGAAFGLVPVTDVAELFHCGVTGGAIAVDAMQATSVPAVWAAGECTGVKGDDAALVEGEIAGCAAAGDARGAQHPALQRRRDAGQAFGRRLEHAFAPRREVLSLADADTIICRCEDVMLGQLDAAWTQRQAKLWTRVGMGACQGAVCGPACAAMFGWSGNAVRAPLGTPRCGDWVKALPD